MDSVCILGNVKYIQSRQVVVDKISHTPPVNRRNVLLTQVLKVQYCCIN